MKINTQKIQLIMKERDLTLESLGKLMRPRMGREATWYAIHKSKSFKPLQRIAKALKVDPKELIE